MLPGSPGRGRRLLALVVAVVVAAGAGAGVGAGVATADTAPPDPAIPVTVSADALPTVQVDGVVWTQAVVGNRVYAGGRFSTARPAGAAAGTSTTARGNLLAYDITTGNLVTSFAPNLNGQVLSVVASPDGSRIYVGGEFTSANGSSRYRLAAYNTADGSLVSTFRPNLDFRVRALAVTDSTVYVGGAFSTANGNPRSRLAAFRTSDGGLLPWAPAADAEVFSMVLTPDRSKVVVGGQFANVSGTAAYGMSALDPTSGAVLPWAANTVVRNAGPNSAVNSLTADGGLVFGTGYKFGTGGNFEGTFAADPANGAIVWLEDCHGDTYSAASAGGVVYTAGHAHFCGNIGGFPETDPKSFHRALAFSRAATQKVLKNTEPGYSNFAGRPAPSLLTWFPEIDAGTFTGQNQGTWSVAGNSDYVVMGGEFPRVNRLGQQGLVRFAVSRIAPDAQGPRLSGSNLVPTLVSQRAGTARVSWTANWDRDNEALTYRVIRDGNTAAPVFTTTARSTFWNRPALGFEDTGLTPGKVHSYRLQVTDPHGNTVVGDPASVTVTATTPSSAYADTVRADGASSLWRLGEPSGSTALDTAGFTDLSLGSGVTRGVAGAPAGNGDAASRFAGTVDGTSSTSNAVHAPNTFSTEAWFRTTSTAGGKIIGFGNKQVGASTNYDRHVYLDATGRVTFGVNPGTLRVITSPGSYNDGAWHHVVATLGSGGAHLYVDGALIGSSTTTTRGEPIFGFWRVGGDNVAKWPGAAGSWFDGTLDEVALYPTVLSAAQVQKHFTTSGPSAATSNAAPVATFTSTASGLTATVDGSGSTDSDGSIAGYSWNFGDGTTATGATASRTYTAGGTYTVRLTVTDDKGATGTTTKAVTVQAPAAPNAAPVAAFTSATSGLTVTVDGSGSTDSDGSIAGYSWDFGDGGTATGATASRTYTAGGTYTVRLTVTDDKGATGTTTKAVTVTSPPGPAAPFAADAFGRTVSGGWGTADTGGAWTVTGGATGASVSGGVGRLTMTAPGSQPTAFLGTTSTDTDLRVSTSVDKVATGGGTYLSVVGRRVGTAGDYRLKLRVQSTGVVATSLVRTVSGTETVLASGTVAGVTYAPGQVLNVRLQVIGTGTTSLAAKVWPSTSSEPAAWQLTAGDTTLALQAAGSLGLVGYLSASSTNAPVTASFDGLTASRTA